MATEEAPTTTVACSTCGRMTPSVFSAALCDSCTRNTKLAFCAGCGSAADPPKVDAGSTAAAGGTSVIAFRRVWHKKCLAFFHPDSHADGASASGSGTALSGLVGSMLGGSRGRPSTPGSSGRSPARGLGSVTADSPGADTDMEGSTSETPTRGGRGSAAVRRRTEDNPDSTFVFYNSPPELTRTPMGDLGFRGSTGGSTIGADFDEAERHDRVPSLRGAGGRAAGGSVSSDGTAASASARRASASSAASSATSSTMPSTYVRVDEMEAVAADARAAGLVSTRRWGLKEYTNVVVGRELVEFLVNERTVPNQFAAVNFGQELMDHGFLQHVTGEHAFQNEYLFYKLTQPKAHELATLRAQRMRSASMTPAAAAAAAAASAAGGVAAAPAIAPARSKAASLMHGGARESPRSIRMREARGAAAAASAALHEDRMVMEGFMLKQGHKFRNWRRRWFVLKGHTLSYHKAPGTPAKGKIDIRGFTLQQLDDGVSMCLTSRDEPSLVYNIRTQSDEQFLKWVRCISTTMEALANQVAI